MSVLDRIPVPGSNLAWALRNLELQDVRERREQAERESVRAAKWQEREDAVAHAELTGRNIPTLSEFFQAVSQLGDLEDEREARRKASASTRADVLEERANVLRSQRDSLRRSENVRLNSAQQQRLVDERDSARRAADAAARGSRRYR